MKKNKKPSKKRMIIKKRKSNEFWDVWDQAGDSMEQMGDDTQWLV